MPSSPLKPPGHSHETPPKYRCPRCSTRTCSLTCTKRHKKWAQCSGVRDPAAYIKRNDLETPKGIDHDFNFLTGIERTLERAERDVLSRGVVRDEDNGPKGLYQRRAESDLSAAIERCNVIVKKAPEGMARAKANQTRTTKK